MLFHKSLVSLVMAFAAASCVIAATTPVARGGAPGPQCNTGSPQCCNTYTSASDSRVAYLSPEILEAAQDSDIPFALDCNDFLFGGGQQW